MLLFGSQLSGTKKEAEKGLLGSGVAGRRLADDEPADLARIRGLRRVVPRERDLDRVAQLFGDVRHRLPSVV